MGQWGQCLQSPKTPLTNGVSIDISWFIRVDVGKVVGSTPPHTENALLAFLPFFVDFFAANISQVEHFPAPQLEYTI